MSTARLLLQCDADVNANYFERFTPLHTFISSAIDCNEAILNLLCDAGAHLDYGSRSGETPIDVAVNIRMKQLLMGRMTLSLKCLCARLIQKAKLPFEERISPLLATFVNRD